MSDSQPTETFEEIMERNRKNAERVKKERLEANRRIAKEVKKKR